MTATELQQAQQRLCTTYGVSCMPAGPESMVGYALYSKGLPLNGLRHDPEGGTSGWYLWHGEELSQADDFFSPLCVQHLELQAPEALRFLGLPPGYRFLVAGDYVDVWYDAALLKAA